MVAAIGLRSRQQLPLCTFVTTAVKKVLTAEDAKDRGGRAAAPPERASHEAAKSAKTLRESVRS